MGDHYHGLMPSVGCECDYHGGSPNPNNYMNEEKQAGFLQEMYGSNKSDPMSKVYGSEDKNDFHFGKKEEEKLEEETKVKYQSVENVEHELKKEIKHFEEDKQHHVNGIEDDILRVEQGNYPKEEEIKPKKNFDNIIEELATEIENHHKKN